MKETAITKRKMSACHGANIFGGRCSECGLFAFDIVNEESEFKGGLKILCPYCKKPWTKGMVSLMSYTQAYDSYDSDSYDSAAEVEIHCESCKKLIYSKEIT